MKNRFLLIAFLSLAAISCQKDQTVQSEPEFPGVQEALWPYFRLFEDEAAARGLTVDLVASRITAEIASIDEGNVIGRCQYGRYSGNHITIDAEFWTRSGHLGREMVVFHELGHCYLGRGHREDAFQSGSCASIMRSGTCCCRDAYRTSTRSYYVDELFSTD
ncbi:MAG: hypothetical protein KTR24_08230 [Saprospiraceae bacterium]|nr:hypothetical protein [Saprospiraceae bacterium]